MTGRVFSKLLFSFVLVLSLGTAILDFSLRRFVQHSLEHSASLYYASRAAGMAAELAATPAARLERVVDAEALAAQADIVVTDATGQVLARSHGLQSSAQAPFPEVQTVPMTGAPALRGSGPAVRQNELLLTLPAGANSVHFRFSLEAVQATLRLLRRDLLLASLLALLLATLLAAFLAHLVGRRLSRIVRFASRIAAGDLSARVEEGWLDEISEVAHALDTTAARLEASFHALDGSRRELAVLLDSMQEAVIGVSPQSQVTWSNSKMRVLSPSAPREGRPLVECIRDPEVLRPVEVALRERRLSLGRATSFVPGRIFAVSAAPMPGGGAVVVLHDVTDVERVERMRRDFVANVSHELRTPLTSITGYVETVVESEHLLSDQGREFLEIVLRNGTRMHRLTQDLLALATVEAGDYRIQPQAVAASTLIHDALDTLAGMALDKGMTFERGPAPQAEVLADVDALNQVFGNLIENAMKYGRSGGRVRVGAREAGPAVEFFVQDFGPGIGSEHLERIFERFYRVDKARSRDAGGTGLGLAIVRHIVLAHRGEIRAESEFGAGTTFLFTLPRAAEARADPGAEDKATNSVQPMP